MRCACCDFRLRERAHGGKPINNKSTLLLLHTEILYSHVKRVTKECHLVWDTLYCLSNKQRTLDYSSNFVTEDNLKLTLFPIQDNNLLKFRLQGGHFGMQCLLELLLLLQVPENFPADSLQALHLPLALVHLTLQGLHTERQLGTERGRGRGLEGNRGGSNGQGGLTGVWVGQWKGQERSGAFWLGREEHRWD